MTARSLRPSVRTAIWGAVRATSAPLSLLIRGRTFSSRPSSTPNTRPPMISNNQAMRREPLCCLRDGLIQGQHFVRVVYGDQIIPEVIVADNALYRLSDHLAEHGQEVGDDDGQVLMPGLADRQRIHRSLRGFYLASCSHHCPEFGHGKPQILR